MVPDAQDSILEMAGLSLPSTQKGLQNLMGYTIQMKKQKARPLVEAKKATDGPRHFYIYRVQFIRRNQIEKQAGGYLVFFTSIIESGMWARLSLGAKCLYLVLRCHAKPDYDLYYEIEGDFPHSAIRKWDVANLTITDLARTVHCTSGMLRNLLGELHQYQLAEQMGRDVFTVTVAPSKIRLNSGDVFYLPLGEPI